jgi:tetratricopeptide (TPR) repeat protein
LRVPVALKVIDSRFSAHPGARTHFLCEARAAARLRHPNVAGVFHFGAVAPTDDGTPLADAECFYAMEWVDGETLEARLHRAGPLPTELVLEIAVEVARALMAAGKHGLVHRDLKPTNIMLVSDTAILLGHGGEARVKVIDFGLAEIVAGADPRESVGPRFSGTPEFASPEQLQGGPVDGRTDIFSLGVTLWYLLCGQLPFNGASGLKDPWNHRSTPLPLAQLYDANVPVPVVSLIQRMLASNPDDRFATAESLKLAVHECLATLRQLAMGTAGLPATGLHPQELYRLAKSALNGSVPSQARYEEAVRLLEEALALDPAFVRAHALIAEVHALIYRKSFDRSPERAGRILAAASSALRLRPDSGEARRALGIYYYYVDGDYERAAAEFRLAINTLSHDSETLFCLGLTARRQHRWADAAIHFEEAARYDPYHPDYGTHWWKTLAGLRRYSEARAVLDEMIASHPEHIHLRVHRAYLDYSEKADLRPLHEVLAQLPANYDPNGTITFLKVGIARYECDANAADRHLAASPLTIFQGHVDGQLYPRESLQFLNLMLRGEMEPVRGIAASLLPGAIAQADTQPNEPGPWMMVAQLHSIVGQRAEALKAGYRALELLPPEKDGVDGPTLAVQLAWAYLHLKEPSPAMDLLEKYAPWPGGLSYGDLLLGNTYDLLRPDPRFKDLLAAVSIGCDRTRSKN